MSIWAWFLLGAGTWALAVVLKVLADFVVVRTAKVELPDWLTAVLSGLWSSLCELGLAVGAFLIWNATFADALVLALGAALAEFVILLPAAISANWRKAQTKAKVSAGWNAFFAERAAAIASHLASRALAWLGVAGAGGLAALGAAFGLFALGETAQAYGQAKDWDYLSPRVFWLSLAFQIAIVAAEIALLVMWSLPA
jgi:hypothetical protein